MRTFNNFHQNFEFMLKLSRYFINVTRINVHINASIIKRFSFGNIAVILSDMWGFLVSQLHKCLFLVLEGLAVLWKRRLFTEVTVKNLLWIIILCLKLDVDIFENSLAVFAAVKGSCYLAETTFLFQEWFILDFKDFHRND